MSSSDLDTLRVKLKGDLEILHTQIEHYLNQIKNENLKNIFELILERQDKLFEYYVSSREDLMLKQSQKVNKALEKPRNSYTECLELLF